MKLITKKPVSNSSRNTVLLNKKPFLSVLKHLSYRKFNKSGRNNTGKITVRGRGGGNRSRLRIVDFSYKKHSKIVGLTYDPHRTAPINLVQNSEGKNFYKLDLENYEVHNVGNVKIGQKICCIETVPNSNAKLCRAAGNYAVVVNQMEEYTHIKLRSGEIRMIHKNCKCYLGSIPFENRKYIKIGNAGRNRRSNLRPDVRGVAMKLNSHPNGGERGKNKGKLSKTFTGKLAVGGRTRYNPSKFTVINSRGKKIKK